MLDESPHPIEENPSPDSYGITGNWWGLRDTLAQAHIFVGGSLLFDTTKFVSGGWNSTSWEANYLLDLHLLAQLPWTPESPGTLYLDFQNHDQTVPPASFIGDAQGRDNITAPPFTQISQAWYRQTWGKDARLKIGKIDANTDATVDGTPSNDAFSLIEHGLDFIHSATSYPVAMATLPSYPEGAPGVELFLGSDFYLGLGAFYSNAHQTFLNLSGHPQDLQPSAGGMFLIAEGGARWSYHDLPGHAGIGTWYHSGNFPLVAADSPAPTKQGNKGGYLFFDQSLFHDSAEGQPERDVGIFALAGLSDKETNFISASVAGGVTFSGFVPTRPDDAIGLMIAWAHLNQLASSPAGTKSFEVATEAYYKCQLTPWASIKPAFQYITHSQADQQDMMLFVVRVEVDF
jgi:porin